MSDIIKETETAVERSMYGWSSAHHDESCPRHADYPRDKYEAAAKAILNLPPEAVLPQDMALPTPDCLQVPGKCCPADIVINAGKADIMIAAQGIEEARNDPPTIKPGERRQGAYYVEQSKLPVLTSLCRVVDLPNRRLEALEKQRRIREGILEPDWVLKARENAKAGKTPAPVSDRQTALANMQQAGAASFFGNE